MVWIVTGFVQGKLRMSKGRSVCTENAKIVEVIDAETSDFFGISIYCIYSLQSLASCNLSYTGGLIPSF
ncbi:hypothetical protein [Nostoc sp.]|uniref:hypothetical protein n=1 Tax=Nostoc sp. TaxID=1180 RepID=UPI002FF5F196